MCGIAGAVHPDRSWSPLRDEMVSGFVRELKRRGPDDQGILSGSGWCLGHSRLSVQDLSYKGRQPLRLAELGLSIVHNGEIYNFRELREDLRSQGYEFFSESDTEVLIKGYHRWGKDLLPKLHGMFAFSIYNEHTHSLFMARDRLGIKPLYYNSLNSKALFWASAPWPLLKTLPSPPTLSKRALNYYFSFHSVVPAPWTLVEGIYKLPPGHFAHWTPEKGLEVESYWSLSFGLKAEQESWKMEDWTEALEEHLRAAVRRRLVADVPVGLFLSGGLDSSLMAAFMTEEMDQTLSTYSVGFSGAGGEEGNEFRYSRQIAQTFQTDHHEFSVTPSELLEHLEDAVRQQTEPMTSHDNIGFYLLSKKAAESIKVVQCGQGADELFAGYHWYPKVASSNDPVKAYQAAFFDRDLKEYQQLIAPEFQDTDFAGEYLQEHFARPGASSALDKALRLDTTVMLVEDPVKRVDSNTMAWGLEARVPFLDHELVEFAATIPGEYKLQNGGKGVLKNLGYKHLPREVIDRPKGYFPVPELKYLDGPFLELARGIMGSQKSQNRGLFQRETLDAFLKEPRSHLTPLHGSKLWQVTALEWWLQLHKIGV